MAGTQIGFKLEDSTHLDVINDIYNQILVRLSKLIQNYKDIHLLLLLFSLSINRRKEVKRF